MNVLIYILTKKKNLVLASETLKMYVLVSWVALIVTL